MWNIPKVTLCRVAGLSFSSRQRGSGGPAHTHAHTGPCGVALTSHIGASEGGQFSCPEAKSGGLQKQPPPTPSRALRKSQPCPLNATHAELCHNRTSLCSQQQVQQQLGCGDRGPSQMGMTRPRMSVLCSKVTEPVNGEKVNRTKGSHPPRP